jgi:hypothetical protein
VLWPLSAQVWQKYEHSVRLQKDIRGANTHLLMGHIGGECDYAWSFYRIWLPLYTYYLAAVVKLDPSHGEIKSALEQRFHNLESGSVITLK